MSRSTWDTFRVLQDFAYEAFALYGVSFHILLLSIRNPTSRSRNPLDKFLTKFVKGLDSSLFARRY